MQGERNRSLFSLAVGIAAAALALLIFVLVSGGDLADAGDDVLPFLFAAATLAALYGWWRDHTGSSRAKEELKSERRLRERIDRARRAEKEWSRELRTQLAEVHRRNGVFGRTNDVREMVLHVTRTLVEAEKALLLTRDDGDGDGKLDLVCHEGFEHDPENSAIAQHFAEQVIERDKTVRMDRPELEAQNRGAADDEIDNVVAIPIFIGDDFGGVVVCANREGGFEELDDDVLLSLGDHAGAVLENSRLHGALRGAYLSTVRVLAEAIEAKDPFLRIHSEDVSGYVAAVADRLGIEARRREEILFASLLHDVGKIGISERILLKPGRLTDEEFSIIKLHSRIGARLVEQVPALESMSPAILHHHERFDGRGYPTGLKGEQIPLEARIISVADSFSAMTTERPYRDPVPVEEALVELERCAGTQFDPQVVKPFVEEVRQRPPRERDLGAISDPELELLKGDGEPVLGYGPAGITDSLTLLYSHRHLHEEAEAQAARAELQDQGFAVALLELVDLSEVNASSGWAAGDRLLIDAARAVDRAAGRCGGTACRYSGRRLALLMPRTDRTQAEVLAGELLGELDGSGPRLRVGTAEWREADSGVDVVHRARLALEPAESERSPAG